MHILAYKMFRKIKRKFNKTLDNKGVLCNNVKYR